MSGMLKKLVFAACLALLLASAVEAKQEDPSGGGRGGGSGGGNSKAATCVAGEAGCAVCDKKGRKCLACVPTPGTTGLFVDKSGVCQPCPDAGCAACQKGAGKCRACLPGMALSKRKTCSTCGEGFVVDKKGRCRACPANCKTCDKKSKCVTCLDGVPNKGGKCRKPSSDDVTPEPENTPSPPSDD